MNELRHEVPDDPTLKLDMETGKWCRPPNTRAIIYPDGRKIDRLSKIPMADITDIICEGTPHRSLTTVNLRDGHVMLVHDMGHILPEPLPGDEYAETFTFVADLDDGTYVQLQLAVTNLGPGAGTGLCRALVKRPGAAPWTRSARTAPGA